MLPEASIRGVSLGSTTPTEWSEMGAAIVAGIEAGWVSPVINKVNMSMSMTFFKKVVFRSIRWIKLPRFIMILSTVKAPKENLCLGLPRIRERDSVIL